MFTHIVFFKLQDESNIEKAADILRGMEGKIPELKELQVGVDVIRSDRSYDIALITKFDNKNDYEIYNSCEYHVNEVIKNLKPMLESSKTVDFE